MMFTKKKLTSYKYGSGYYAIDVMSRYQGKYQGREIIILPQGL